MTVATTSIEAYHGIVQDKKQRQYAKILGVLRDGKDYSFTEIFELTGILPSTASARMNELRDKLKLVERAPRRACKVTSVCVIPHRLTAETLASIRNSDASALDLSAVRQGE